MSTALLIQDLHGVCSRKYGTKPFTRELFNLICYAQILRCFLIFVKASPEMWTRKCKF